MVNAHRVSNFTKISLFLENIIWLRVDNGNDEWNTLGLSNSALYSIDYLEWNAQSKHPSIVKDLSFQKSLPSFSLSLEKMSEPPFPKLYIRVLSHSLGEQKPTNHKGESLKKLKLQSEVNFRRATNRHVKNWKLTIHTIRFLGLSASMFRWSLIRLTHIWHVCESLWPKV